MPIPPNTTPIKHEVLTDIFAKGLLSYPEMRIVCQIIRLSWGYDDPKNGRRQDWTNPLTIAELSKQIEMSYAEVYRNIKTMTGGHILLKDDDKYQFNEHYEQYDRKSYMTGSHKTMTENHTNMTGSHTDDVPQPQIETELKGENGNHKDTSKETSKETIKKTLSTSLTENSLKEKTNEETVSQPVAKVKGLEMQELIKVFCQEMGFQYGKASIKINVKPAKWLLENYELEQILSAVKWQKSKIIKEKKNPAIFIPNLVTVQKWIDNWLGLLTQEKEKETKDKKGGYLV